MSRLLVRLAPLLAALAACVQSPQRDAAAPGPEAGRPNIVIFIGDDHTVTDLGCYGSPVARTPHLDRLAAQGLRFTRAFTATAMCSPSRSMLYTGLYPHRNGCHRNHGEVLPGTRSLPHFLEPLGYRVALAGKTHVRPRESFPFEYLPWGTNDGVAVEKVEAFLTRDAAPFCLVIGSNEPHAPHASGGFTPEEVVLPPHLIDTPETRRDYADYLTDVEALDREVGVALELLDKHALAERTLFIYLGDHGNGIFAKWTCYDMGIRTPFLARWPGVIAPGRVTEAMVSFVDVLPTCLEAVGGAAPEGIDGRSFLAVLRGESDAHRDVVFATHTTRGIISGSDYPIRAVRTRDLKYVRNLNASATFENVITNGRPGRAEGPSPVWASWLELAATDGLIAPRVSLYQTRPAEELYDLRVDPFERVNRVGDSAYSEPLETLRRELDAWMAEQGDEGMAAELSGPPWQPARQRIEEP